MKTKSNLLFFLIFSIINPVYFHGQEYKKKAEMDMVKAEFQSFLNLEMQYPLSDLENGKEGIVKLELTVDSTGLIKDIDVVEAVSAEIDKEAVRLVRYIGFTPAFIGGRNIDSRISLEIRFDIRKYRKACKERGYETIDYNRPIDTSFKVYPAKYVELIPKPVFDGKEVNLNRFITDQMKYPETAFNQNISGTVKLGYIIEKSGNATHINVLEPVGGGCDQEAIRILKMIKWEPGIKDKKAVRTYMTLDFTFSLAGESDHLYLPNNQNNSM